MAAAPFSSRSSRPRSGSDAGSVASGASFRSKGSITSRASRTSTRPLEEIAGKLNSEASERFGSMGVALKGLNTDTQGNVSRGEVRRLFAELGQNRQTADNCFDSMSDRGSVDLRSLRDVLQDKPQRSRGSSRAGSEADLVTTIKPPSRAPAADPPTAQSTAREPAVAWGSETDPGSRMPAAGMDVDRRSNTSADRGNMKVEQASDSGKQASDSGKQASDSGSRNGRPKEKQVRGPIKEEDAEINYEELFLSRNISPQLTRNLQLLGPALGRKFRTIRRAFRDVDTDHSNTVSREETREFFQHFGFLDPGPADEFFDTMDADGGGVVDYVEFQKVFAPYIYGISDLGSSCLPMKPREKLQTTRSTPNLARSEAQDTWSCRGKKLKDNELSNIVGQVSDIMNAKYGSIRKAFKGVSENHETMLSRQDVRSFFRTYGFANVADQFFDRLDSGSRGRINYREFQAHFARHLEPTHNVCKRVSERFFGDTGGDFDGQTTYRSSFSCAQARGLL